MIDAAVETQGPRRNRRRGEQPCQEQDGEEAFFEGFHCAPTYLRAAAMLIELSHGRQGVLYGYPST